MAEDPTYDIQLEAEQINNALLQVHNADSTPTAASDNMVRSSGVKQALQTEQTARIDGDAALQSQVDTLVGNVHFAQVRGNPQGENLQTTDFSSGDITVDLGADRVTFNKTGVWRISGSLNSVASTSASSPNIAFGYKINGSNREYFYRIEVEDMGSTANRDFGGGASYLVNLNSGDYFSPGDNAGMVSGVTNNNKAIYNFEYIGTV